MKQLGSNAPNHPLKKSVVQRFRGKLTSPSVLVPNCLNNCTKPTQPITTFGFSKDFREKFDVGDILGEGTFGTVRLAISKSSGEKFAVKHMPKRFESHAPGAPLERFFVRRVQNEVDIGRHLGRSLNVCYFLKAYEEETSVDLVFELCRGGLLWDAVQGGKYSEKDASRLVRDVLRTVAQCHAQGVIMRDIKPENFLFASEEEGAPLKAIDFGLSLFCAPGEVVSARAGTAVYVAPEVLKCCYSLPADIWSAGIVAYQLLTGRLPFSGDEGQEVTDQYSKDHTYNHKEAFRAVLYSELDFESPPWDTLSSAAKDLVRKLLQRDPLARLTAEEALQHPWIDDEAALSHVPMSDSIIQRLQRFGTYGHLKQAALRVMAEVGANPVVPQGMLQLFLELDPRNTGHVEKTALQAALQNDGRFHLSDDEADHLLAQVEDDEDESGLVSVNGWIAALADWGALQQSSEWQVYLKKAFEKLDKRNRGLIGKDELQGLLCGEGGCEFEDEIDAALREADADHDGGISLEEFQTFMTSQRIEKLDLFQSRLRTVKV